MMFDNDGDLIFAEDTTIDKVEKNLLYKILIVDDEPSVHEVTNLSLGNITYEGSSLELLHAYSAAQAKSILETQRDIAVILLDVVMETNTAGLDLVKVIRDDLGNKNVRIILRTGQPGQVPEDQVILKYHVNDYKNKTELTTQKLFTTVITALRSYNDLVQIKNNKDGLEKVISSTSSIIKMKSLDIFFNGLLEQVVALTCSADIPSTQYPKAYVGFYKDDILQFETCVDHVGDSKACISNMTTEYKKEIEKILKDHKKIKTDKYALFYQSTDNDTALLLLLKGDMTTINVEDTLLELFMKDATITYDNLLLAQDIKESQKETIFMLSEMAEKRSKETGKHVKRVAYFAKEIAQELKLKESDVEQVFIAAPMHDVGKIGIKDAVLKKPGSLTNEEFKEMKEHSVIGYNLLKDSDRKLMQKAAIIAHEHHERWDGKGYPRGLVGENIHLFGRIVALCDVFDALTSKRVYKDVWQIDKVRDLIKQERNKQFDPKVVDAFFARFDKILEIKDRLKD